MSRENIAETLRQGAEERLPKVDLRAWHDEGHLASLVHDREIVSELLNRAERD